MAAVNGNLLQSSIKLINRHYHTKQSPRLRSPLNLPPFQKFKSVSNWHQYLSVRGHLHAEKLEIFPSFHLNCFVIFGLGREVETEKVVAPNRLSFFVTLSFYSLSSFFLSWAARISWRFLIFIFFTCSFCRLQETEGQSRARARGKVHCKSRITLHDCLFTFLWGLFLAKLLLLFFSPHSSPLPVSLLF